MADKKLPSLFLVATSRKALQNGERMKPIVGITMGDPAGNGPEITIKALAHEDIYDRCRPIVVGDAKMLVQACTFVGREDIKIQNSI